MPFFSSWNQSFDACLGVALASICDKYRTDSGHFVSIFPRARIHLQDPVTGLDLKRRGVEHRPGAAGAAAVFVCASGLAAHSVNFSP